MRSCDRFITNATVENYKYLEAYKNRGEVPIQFDRVKEGEKGIQRAEIPKMSSDQAGKKQKKVVEKYNLQEADDLWGDVVSEDSYVNDDDLFLDDLLGNGDYSGDKVENEQLYDADEDLYEQENLLYDDAYSEDEVEDEQTLFETVEEQSEDEVHLDAETFSEQDKEHEQITEETAQVSAETNVCSAILEHVGGMRQEVACVRLFEPENNTLVIIDEKTNDEQVVFFDQLSCIRVSSLPAGISNKKKESSTKEIIETVDGNIYHERVHSEQDFENLLFCFASDDQSPFAFTLFPKSNIKKRIQDKQVIDILLEKRLISKVMLQRALQEFEQIKSMKLENIIAKKARIPLAKIKEILDQAEQGPMQGMQKEEVLLFSGLVSESEILDAVERIEKIKKLRIGQFLVERGVVRESEVYASLAEKHRVPFINLKGRKFSQKSLASLPKNMIVNNEILPIALKDDILIVASHYVDMSRLTEAIIKITGCKNVKFVLSPPAQIRKIIKMLFAQRQ